MKKFIISFAVLCTIIVNAAEFSMGDVKIKLPELPGYTNTMDVHPELHAHLCRFMQSQYSNPASYILTSDAEIIKKSSNKRLFEDKTYQSHIMVTFLKQLANYAVKQNEFDTMKTALKKVYAGDLKLLEKKIKEQEKFISDKGEFKYNTEKMIPCGISFENDDCIIGSMIANHKIEKMDFSQVSSIAILKVKNRLVYIYVFKEFKTKKDLEYTKKNAKLLVQKIFELNK